MHVIQAGTKFVKVQYYIDPTEIYSVAISASPNIYKNKQTAKEDLAKLDLYLDQKIAWAEQQIQANEAVIELSEKNMAKLRVKLEGLMDLPYRQVYKQVEQTQRAIAREQSSIDSHRPSLRSFRSDLARYAKLRAMDLRVCELAAQQ